MVYKSQVSHSKYCKLRVELDPMSSARFNWARPTVLQYWDKYLEYNVIYSVCHQLTQAAEASLQTQKASSSLLTGLITMLTIGSAFISSDSHAVNWWRSTSPTWTWRLTVAVFLILLRYDPCNSCGWEEKQVAFCSHRIVLSIKSLRFETGRVKPTHSLGSTVEVPCQHQYCPQLMDSGSVSSPTALCPVLASGPYMNWVRQ